MNTTELWKRTLPGLVLRAEDLFFPPRCPICDGLTERGERIHSACRKLLTLSDEPVCLRCGRKILSERAEYCSQCRKRTPAFERGHAVFVYSGPIRETMYRFKYANRREYALFFADTAMELYMDWLRRTAPECIIPVPMYSRKQKKRGYNQAESFARELSRCSGIPLEKRAVFRIRNTQPLKLMNTAQRQRELQGAFAAGPAAGKYRCVLLVDDIYTTGSTVEAVTGVLKTVGVEKVFVLSVTSPMGDS